MGEIGPEIFIIFASDAETRCRSGCSRGNFHKDPQGVPTTPFLTSRGGGGGSDHFAMRFWCFPLPPPGPMHVYVEWADADIAETMVTLDATSIINAAPNAVTLWKPDE
jgi:hypothetical protein